MLFQISSIIGLSPIKMQLELFGDALKFMPEFFGQNTGMPSGLGNVCPKRFGSRTDDLLNLHQRFLVHDSTPTKELLQD